MSTGETGPLACGSEEDSGLDQIQYVLYLVLGHITKSWLLPQEKEAQKIKITNIC